MSLISANREVGTLRSISVIFNLAVENVTKKLEDLPRVEPREGANGELQLNNLQSFHCKN